MSARHAPRTTALALAIALSLSARQARADEQRPVVFSLSVGAEPLERCGGTDALAEAVEQRLRRPVFTDVDAADIAIAVASEDEAEPSEWRARIVATDRAGAELGRRDVPLPRSDCPKAIDTLAVVLAIMIGPPRTMTDPPWRAESPEVPAEPPPPPTPPERRAPARRSPRPPRRPSPAPLRWEAGPLVGIVGGSGVLPDVALGVEAGALVRPPVERLAIALRATYFFPRSTPTSPPADVDRIGGSLAGCYTVVGWGRFALGACAGFDVSRIETRSASLTIPVESSVLPAILFETRLGYRVPVGGATSIELYLAPQVSALLRRDRFTYRDISGEERTLLFPSPAAFQTSLGGALHFF